MEDVLLQKVVVYLLPFMQMYGLYIVFHGHLSPGGAFAGGMVIGLSMIAYGAVYGIHRGTSKLPHRVTAALESVGALWYGAMGLVGLARGASFLVNQGAGIPLGRPGDLFSGGLILLITLGVGIKVASTVVTLFYVLMEGDEGE